MRCFAAIEVNRAAIDLASELRSALGVADTRWRDEKWVDPENLHITLAFYGDVAEDRIPDIVSALSRAPVEPFPLTSPGFAARPPSRRAGMLWLTFADETGRASALADWARAAGGSEGETQSRPFVPHVTLVRARRPHGLSAEAKEAAAEILHGAGDLSVSVRTVRVFSSTLTPSGPRYRLLETVPLPHR